MTRILGAVVSICWERSTKLRSMKYKSWIHLCDFSWYFLDVLQVHFLQWITSWEIYDKIAYNNISNILYRRTYLLELVCCTYLWPPHMLSRIKLSKTQILTQENLQQETYQEEFSKWIYAAIIIGLIQAHFKTTDCVQFTACGMDSVPWSGHNSSKGGVK